MMHLHWAIDPSSSAHAYSCSFANYVVTPGFSNGSWAGFACTPSLLDLPAEGVSGVLELSGGVRTFGQCCFLRCPPAWSRHPSLYHYNLRGVCDQFDRSLFYLALHPCRLRCTSISPSFGGKLRWFYPYWIPLCAHERIWGLTSRGFRAHSQETALENASFAFRSSCVVRKNRIRVTDRAIWVHLLTWCQQTIVQGYCCSVDETFQFWHTLASWNLSAQLWPVCACPTFHWSVDTLAQWLEYRRHLATGPPPGFHSSLLKALWNQWINAAPSPFYLVPNHSF